MNRAAAPRGAFLPLILLHAGCASTTALTAAEGQAIVRAAEPPRPAPPARFALLVEARPPRGPTGELHVIADGARMALVLIDPLGVGMRAVVRPDLVWLVARSTGGAELVVREPEPSGGRDGLGPRCARALRGACRLRPFVDAPLDAGTVTAARIDGDRIEVETAPHADGLAERRVYDRKSLRCVRREALHGGEVVARLLAGDTPDRLTLELVQLHFALALTLVERDDAPDIATGAFDPG